MALEHGVPHLANCDCGFCQHIQAPPDQKFQPEAAVVAMPRDRKDYFDEESYETESDSDMNRSKRDERIRQAPYLPRVQIWARDSGPYTLRVGNQWFHCDDLLINGEEYRQHTRRTPASQTSRSTPSSNTQSGPPSATKRRPMNRAGSYQRVRENGPTPRPANALVRQASRDKVPGTGRYESQAIPTPSHRKHASRKPDDATQRKYASRSQELGTSPQIQSGAAIPTDASSGQLVPYKAPPTSNPPSAYYPPKQTRAPRPGRLSRGSSYQIPVRNKSKKNVRFELPTPI